MNTKYINLVFDLHNTFLSPFSAQKIFQLLRALKPRQILCLPYFPTPLAVLG